MAISTLGSFPVRIDFGNCGSVAVTDQDPIQFLVVKNEVRILIDWNLLEGLEGIGIEDGHGGVAAVGNEASM